MITNNNYISIKEVLSRILRHPLLQDVSLEQAIQYTIDFMYIFGFPSMYNDKEVTLKIEDYRTLLPCDLISIIQIKDNNTNSCLRYMTNSFDDKNEDLTYKTQGNILYTSFKNGEVTLSYKSIAVDENGYPLLIDNPLFLKTLELYIKKEIFTILFDMNKINSNVLQNTQQQYAWSAGQLQSEFIMPSLNEMESIKNSFCNLIQRVHSFESGFKYHGNKSIFKKH